MRNRNNPRRTRLVHPPAVYEPIDDGPTYFRRDLVGEEELSPPTQICPAPRLLPSDSAERKKFPIGTGVLDYFPDALAAIAEVSYLGNQKHNPGEPLHWARGKSNDHADCIIRHFEERGTRDDKGVRHSAQLAWRALALLQEELEQEAGLALPRGAWPPVQQA